jgi:hypothetical protein
MKIHGKLTQNAEPLDTTTSLDEQIEKATYNAVAQEISRQHKTDLGQVIYLCNVDVHDKLCWTLVELE